MSHAVNPTKYHILILLLGIFCLNSPLLAQSYKQELFSEEEGLTDRYVYTINQDLEGFLWIGTGNGLFRFDGSEFETYKGDSAGLAENFFTCSFRDSENRMWFGHFEGGVTVMEKQQARPALPAKLITSRISGIAEDPAGNIWIASQRNGLIRLNKDLEYQHFPNILPSTIVLSMAITPENKILIGTDEGLKVLTIGKNNIASFSHDVDSVPLSGIQCIVPHHRRPGYWLGTQDMGLVEYIPGTMPALDEVKVFSSENGFPIDNIRSVFEDAEENVWVGSFDRGLAKFNDKDVSDRLRHIAPVLGSDTVGNCQVECLFGDKFGQVWLGIYNVGMVCMAEEEFSSYFLKKEDQEIRETFTSIEDHTGNIWFGTDSGLFMVEKSRIFDNDLRYSVQDPLSFTSKRHYTMADSLPSNHITALFEDRSQRIWIGTERDGLCILNAERDHISTIDLNSISLSKAINAITEDQNGNIWVATTDGAFQIPPDSGASIAYYSTRNGLAHNNIYDIFPDSKGRVWLATHTNSVTIFDGNNFESLTVTVQGEVPNISCIAEDDAGNIWLGTDGMGMYMYDGESFVNYSEANGLLSNYCYQLVFDRAQTVWIAHRNGLSRFVPETKTFNRFPNRSHFDFEENTVHSSDVDSRGNIWYGTAEGIVRHNWIPARTRIPAPYTFIQSVSFFGKNYPLDEDLVLSYDAYRVKFKFIGLTFLKQSSVKYQYKLEGRAPEWSEPTSQNSVTFQSLEEGDYTFSVRACNSMGLCNEDSVEYSFSIRPPFWKTWWFRLLILLSVAGMIFLYVRYRIHRLSRQKMVLEETVLERTEEIRQANLELEKLSLVARETDNAVFILDSKGNLEYINQGFTRLTGYEYQEVIEMRKGVNFLETSTNPRIRELLNEVVTKNTSVQYESELPSKTGENIWVISTLTPILDENGKLRKIVIIDSNITQQKQAEDKIRQMNSELEDLVAERTKELAVANQQLQVENEEHIKTAERLRVINQELDNFVYRASHDLMGPLAQILGLVDVARMDLKEQEDALNYLQLIEKSGRRLNVILVDLIEATQVKQGKIEFSKINVRELASEVLETPNSKEAYEGHVFKLEVDPSLEMVSDRRLLTSILQNFIENSVKYRDPAKDKHITWINITRQEDKTIDFAIRDNGIGIPEDLQGKVFDMFFRGTSQVDGSGLGLYIVKQAAEKLKGTIDMESEFGVGTTFKVFIPDRDDSEIGVVQESRY
jgi:PAS domain S-box-containing protein